MIDRDGIYRAYVTCGTIMDAVLAQHEDLKRLQHPKLEGQLDRLNEAASNLEEAANDLRHFWDFTQECAVCDGIIGDAARAEVVIVGADEPRHHYIIHQSCFRTNEHEIA